MFHSFKSNCISLVLVVIISVTLLPLNMQSQMKPGYEYSYDNHGNRVKREGKIVQLKSADTTMTETTVGYFNIRIYPNPTSDFITFNNESADWANRNWSVFRYNYWICNRYGI